MFNVFSKVFMGIVFSSFFSSNIAQSTQTNESSSYDCSFELSKGEQSIRSLKLTEEVYRCFQFDNYTDLGVVNADSQLVPFTLSTPVENVNREHYTKDIPFYQEPEVSNFKTGDQIRRIAALTGVISNNISTQQWQQTNIHYSSVILEQPKHNNEQYGDKLLSLSLDINSSEAPIHATVLVEMSNDLQNWKTLSKPYNFYFLPGKDKNINNNRLELSYYQNHDAKYFRLATLSNVEAFTTLIDNISGSYEHTNRTTQATQWLTVKPYKIDGTEGVWQFDLPSLIPVSTLRFSNAKNIVLYQGLIFSAQHNNPKKLTDNTQTSGKKKLKQAIKNAVKGKSRNTQTESQWKTVIRFNRYKLMLEKGSAESPDMQFSHIKSRAWRIKFNEPSGLRTDQLPTLELGWKPSELTFIAQGEGPFTLLAGRNLATKKATFPTKLRNLNVTTEPVTLKGLVKIVPSKPISSKLNDKHSNKTDWAKMLLWSLLLIGVCLMLYMAYRLIQTMNENS